MRPPAPTTRPSSARCRAAPAACWRTPRSGATAGLRATLPIFQGGRAGALIRQSQARQSVALENAIATERDVIATVRAAYSSWRASNEIIVSTQTAVEAAELSLEGVRAEQTVGNRTILDFLDAQQELLRAQVQLVTARRNAYIAGFTLLAAMGHAEARDLGLEEFGPLYDPVANYERVRGNIWDWSNDPESHDRSRPAPLTSRRRTRTFATCRRSNNRRLVARSRTMRHEGEPSVEEILESIKKVIARDNREAQQAERRRRESAGMPLTPGKPTDHDGNELDDETTKCSSSARPASSSRAPRAAPAKA